jgi:hypothetical protein
MKHVLHSALVNVEQYYTVTELPYRRGADWKYVIGGYRNGELILETVHGDESSRDIEIAAWKSRGFVERLQP